MLYFQARTIWQLIDFTTAHFRRISYDTVFIRNNLFQLPICAFTRSNFVAARTDDFTSFLGNSFDRFLEMLLTSLRCHGQVRLKRHAVFALHYFTFSLFIENIRNHLSKDVHHILQDQHPRLHRCKNHKSSNKSSAS